MNAGEATRWELLKVVISGGTAAGDKRANATVKKTPEEIVQGLMNDFLDDTRERLSSMENTLNSLHTKDILPEDALVFIKREAHNIKGIAATFDFEVISQIMHRLEDYLALAPLTTFEEWRDAQIYLDKSEAIINAGVTPNPVDTKKILSTLPGYRRRDISENVFSEIKVLLITRSRTIAKVVQEELLSYGFQVLTEKDPFKGLSCVVHSKPDLVIASEELDGLNGISLLRAIMAIPATENIPLLLLSSFSSDYLYDRGLPEGVPVVGLGSDLNDKLAMSLTSLEYRWTMKQAKQ